VDCDPQSNSTSGLGLVKNPDRISIYDVMMGVASAEESLQLSELEQLWLIPSHKNLIGANIRTGRSGAARVSSARRACQFARPLSLHRAGLSAGARFSLR